MSRQPTLAQRSAARRKAFHLGQLGSAQGFRAQFWRVASWLVSEGGRLDPAGQSELLDELQAVAERLNERSAARDG
jgi:hypothetical protein